MKEITAAARREGSFPVPINVNTRRAGRDEQEKNEKGAFQRKEYTCEDAGRSTYRTSMMRDRLRGLSADADFKTSFAPARVPG